MSSAEPLPETPLDPRVERSRERVLAAALDILRERGPGALTVEEVVQRSGVARMTIYRHWASRDELLRDAFRRLVPEPGPPPHAVDGTALERLQSAVVAYGNDFATADWADAIPGLLEYSRQHPEHAHMWIDFAASRGEHLTALLRECVGEGHLAPLDVDVAISQLMGPIAFRRFLSFEPLTDEFCLQLVTDLIKAHQPS